MIIWNPKTELVFYQVVEPVWMTWTHQRRERRKKQKRSQEKRRNTCRRKGFHMFDGEMVDIRFFVKAPKRFYVHFNSFFFLLLLFFFFCKPFLGIRSTYSCFFFF